MVSNIFIYLFSDTRLTPSAVEVILPSDLEGDNNLADFPLEAIPKPIPPPPKSPSPDNTPLVEKFPFKHRPIAKSRSGALLTRQDAVQSSSGSLDSPQGCGLTVPDSTLAQASSVPNVQSDCLAPTGDYDLCHKSQPALYHDSREDDQTSPLLPPEPDIQINANLFDSYHGHDQDDLSDHVSVPLETLGGDDDDDDDEDDDDDDHGSREDLLNANSVFTPAEDGPPASYTAEESPFGEHEEEGLHEGDDDFLNDWVEDECDAEIEKITGPSDRDTPSPRPTFHLGDSPEPEDMDVTDTPHESENAHIPQSEDNHNSNSASLKASTQTETTNKPFKPRPKANKNQEKQTLDVTADEVRNDKDITSNNKQESLDADCDDKETKNIPVARPETPEPSSRQGLLTADSGSDAATPSMEVDTPAIAPDKQDRQTSTKMIDLEEYPEADSTPPVRHHIDSVIIDETKGEDTPDNSSKDRPIAKSGDEQHIVVVDDIGYGGEDFV